MKVLGRWVAVPAALALAALAARADATVVIGDLTTVDGLKGNLVTANVQVPLNVSTTLFTVPDDRFFVLRSFCASTTSYPALTGSTLGSTALPLSYQGGCTSLSPGMLIPKGEVLICNGNGQGGYPGPCTLTGILLLPERHRGGSEIADVVGWGAGDDAALGTSADATVVIGGLTTGGELQGEL